MIGLTQVHNQLLQMFTFKVAYQANHIAPYTSCYTNTGGSACIQKITYSISSHLWSPWKLKEFHFLEAKFKLIIFLWASWLHLWNKIKRNTGWLAYCFFVLLFQESRPFISNENDCDQEKKNYIHEKARWLLLFFEKSITSE